MVVGVHWHLVKVTVTMYSQSVAVAGIVVAVTLGVYSPSAEVVVAVDVGGAAVALVAMTTPAPHWRPW